jgi:dipeptidyl-peptidase-3
MAMHAVVVVALLGAAAGSASAPAPASAPGSVSSTARPLATLGDILVVALDAPAFDRLPREQKLLAYWLAEAAAAGDAIAWDQSYRHNLTIVRLLRGILAHGAVAPPETLERVRAFARLVYLNRGLHDSTTGRKLVPQFGPAELRTAALAARADGATFELGSGVQLETALRALVGPLFDPAVDPLRTDKAPAPGQDPLRTSAINFYLGVSRGDLEGFAERFPLNSRLVKDEGALREEVWRAGRPAKGRAHPAVAPGMYADRLERVVAALEQAQALARGLQQKALRARIAFLRTGELAELRSADRDWVRQATPVDAVLGFVETYADPRGRKALFEGYVGIEDPERSRALRALSSAAGWLEAQLPIAQQYKRPRPAMPTAAALWPIASAGDARPLGIAGVSLPNEQAEREQHGSKSLLFPAVDDAMTQVREAALLREFAPAAVASELARCRPQLRFARAALHEIAGHASGQVSPELAREKKDPAELLGGDADTLEEARADLVAHWTALDPRARELGLIADARCQALYPQWVVTDLSTGVAEIPEGDSVTEDHQRAAALIRSWLAENGAMVEERQQGRRVFLAVPERFRDAVGGLLALLQDIKGRGDAARLSPLLRQRADRLDPVWRDEVVARMGKLGLPRRVEILLPRVVVADEPAAPKERQVRRGRARKAPAAARIGDVRLDVPVDLDARILQDWSGF